MKKMKMKYIFVLNIDNKYQLKTIINIQKFIINFKYIYH